ncbi:uncharacterized protein LOC127790838 [Diospyros lotus]|uniref:uncharacterized protein LOC127790838 n=1 Tax=Diospyros lotus TaxID=55363 RepID=UPI00225AE417|nr:uncharacterized protein LOC127790838 [Diospyros lotus]XP_052176512.1 uncharacterized protein LOC127790838 [Diospyros lotus]
MSILKHQLACLHQSTSSRFNSKQPFRIYAAGLNKPSSFPVRPYNPRYDQRLSLLKTRSIQQDALAVSITTDLDIKKDGSFTFREIYPKPKKAQAEGKSFWGAVSLIIGTAVGPGMLGLPAATIRSGPLPSTIAILLSWVYVMSSILLVAELSFAAMEEDNVSEVSFTGLATKGLGPHAGAFVALVYASLSFSLLVACVSGLGSIFTQWLPWINPLMAHALSPFVVGVTVLFFPFKTIDAANRLLCLLMVLSLSGLVGFGLLVGRTSILASLGHALWSLPSILPAIPVTVLTLGFHVITPFVCKIAGNSIEEASRAILIGGVVPLVMVLSWNLIVLGLAGTNTALPSSNPISLLLSVNPSAASAVQGFAFTALATSLIGYAVSFPKQVSDTLGLISGKPSLKQPNQTQTHFPTPRKKRSSSGNIAVASEARLQMLLMPFLIGIPVLIASFFPTSFSRALDFAGTYANCFLFGILPPAMAYVNQSRKRTRPSILPGGKAALLLLFSIAIILGIWH